MNNSLNSWGNTLIQSFYDVWSQVAGFVPKLIGAIIILIIGWIIASALEALARKLFHAFKVDNLTKQTETHLILEKVGIRSGISTVLAKIVKWFLVIVSLSAAVEVLNIQQLSTLMNNIVLYIPNVFLAVLIIVLGLILGRIVYDIIRSAVMASQIPNSAAEILAGISKWLVIVFSFMAALVQMGIARALIEILFTGVVAMIAIGGGLALGLGGKDKVKVWLDKLNW